MKLVTAWFEKGCTIEIFISFEFLHDPSAHALDHPFLEKKQELYKKVFSHFHILEWYSTGSGTEECDVRVRKALMDVNESPAPTSNMVFLSGMGLDLCVCC
jgi:COP9 signalosome complex subunit 6